MNYEYYDDEIRRYTDLFNASYLIIKNNTYSKIELLKNEISRLKDIRCNCFQVIEEQLVFNKNKAFEKLLNNLPYKIQKKFKRKMLLGKEYLNEYKTEYLSTFFGKKDVLIPYIKNKINLYARYEREGIREYNPLKNRLRLTQISITNEKLNSIEKGYCIGVEIECLIPEKNYDNFIYKIKLARLHDSIDLKYDVSIQLESGYVRKEINIIDDIRSLKRLQKLCTILENYNTKVNISCGLHIHFDQRHENISNRAISYKGKRLARFVKQLKQILPKSRHNNRYCLKDFSGVSSNSRYSFVNCTSYGVRKTIEVRGHSGTINFEKIKQWAIICYTILESNKRPSRNITFQNIIEVASFYQLSNETKNYILQKYIQFNTNDVTSYVLESSEVA